MASLDWRSIRGHHPLDRLPDFSAAGYGVLPDWTPATNILYPYADARDRTSDIQRAVDAGGVIELADGVYPVHGQVCVTTSHTILRGSPNGALLDIQGTPRTVFTVGIDDPGRPKLSNRVKILDEHVPTGGTRLRIDNPRLVTPGSRVYIERKATAEWIKAMGMDKLVRNGQPQTWIRVGAPLKAPREVVAVEGDIIVLDIGLTDALDAAWGPGELITYVRPQQTVEIGLANLTMRIWPSHSGDGIANTPNYLALLVNPYVESLWIRNVAIEGFLASVILEGQTSRITIQDSVFRRTAPTDHSRGWPMDVTLKGTRALVLRCRSEAVVRGANAFAVGTQSMNSGPNAVIDYVATGGWLAPHQRWATGLLLENCDVDKIELANRGVAGSGQGWSIGNAVAWNCRTSNRVNAEKPPLAQNWAIGCVGQRVGDGAFLHHGAHVQPASLFTAQIEQRYGPDTAARILGPSYRPSQAPPPIPHHLRPAGHVQGEL